MEYAIVIVKHLICRGTTCNDNDNDKYLFDHKSTDSKIQ